MEFSTILQWLTSNVGMCDLSRYPSGEVSGASIWSKDRVTSILLSDSEISSHSSNSLTWLCLQYSFDQHLCSCQRNSDLTRGSNFAFVLQGLDLQLQVMGFMLGVYFKGCVYTTKEGSLLEMMIIVQWKIARTDLRRVPILGVSKVSSPRTSFEKFRRIFSLLTRAIVWD